MLSHCAYMMLSSFVCASEVCRVSASSLLHQAKLRLRFSNGSLAMPFLVYMQPQHAVEKLCQLPGFGGPSPQTSLLRQLHEV